MSAHPKIPMTHTTIERADGSSAEVAHVDHAALFDQWDAFDNELWTLDAGDLHNVIDHARERVGELETQLAQARRAADAVGIDRDRYYDAMVRWSQSAAEAEARIEAARAIVDRAESIEGERTYFDDIRAALAAVPPETP